MKILITTPTLTLVGGVSNFYRTIQSRFTVDVIYHFIGARSRQLGIVRLLYQLIADYARFFKILKTVDIDIVHLNPSMDCKSFFRDAIYLLLAKSFNKKVVILIPGWQNSFAEFIHKHFHFLLKKIYFTADAMIVLASESRKMLQMMGYAKYIYLLMPPVDDDIFFSIEDQIATNKGRGEKGDITILCYSRIERAKGIYEAIKTYEILKSKYPSLRMTIAGDGSELANLKRYTADKMLGGITFTGYVLADEKREVLLKSDILLFPTYHGEGTPTSVLEAMAYGLAIVTRPVGGLADFFVNGVMGYMTESRDPLVFSNLVEKLIESEEVRMRMAWYNHKYAKENFLASIVVNKLEYVYQSVYQDVEIP